LQQDRRGLSTGKPPDVNLAKEKSDDTKKIAKAKDRKHGKAKQKPAK
jgi:hypothetical protein